MQSLAVEQYEDKVRGAKTPSFLLFYTPGCALCDKMQNALQEIEDSLGEHRVASWKIAISDNPAFASKFHATFAPTTLIFLPSQKSYTGFRGIVPSEILLEHVLAYETTMPGLLQRGYSLLQSAGRMIRLWNWNRKLLVSRQERSTRLSICSMCPFRSEQNICTSCGCYISMKTRLSTEICPQGKW